MTQDFFEPNEAINKIYNLKNEELAQIIQAILAGKYSWACVLILYFTGYNPLEYIPYRTFVRLIKNNPLPEKNNLPQTTNQNLELLELDSTWMELGNSKHDVN
ncbi:MAG: HetP family heterocyst commitment protein [Desmonostoc vinosum HA7617-LM4]|jgi:hypothetical protein|nr:HetP family heterocyst commitment protein [Desmonostoc vinosum HA7617-LM4]